MLFAGEKKRLEELSLIFLKVISKDIWDQKPRYWPLMFNTFFVHVFFLDQLNDCLSLRSTYLLLNSSFLSWAYISFFSEIPNHFVKLFFVALISRRFIILHTSYRFLRFLPWYRKHRKDYLFPFNRFLKKDSKHCLILSIISFCYLLPFCWSIIYLVWGCIYYKVANYVIVQVKL